MSMILISFYPIMVYFLSFYFRLNNLPELPFHGYLQVYFSSPILIISGSILIFYLKKVLIGGISLICGLVWFFTLLSEIITK